MFRISQDIFRTTFKKYDNKSERKIMRIRRSKSLDVRRHGENDENRMNVIQNEMSIRRWNCNRPRINKRYSFWPCRNIWLLLLFTSSLCISHCRWHHLHHRLLFAYFLFISHVSFIKFIVSFFSRFIPKWCQLCRSQSKNHHVIFDKFSTSMILRYGIH